MKYTPDQSILFKISLLIKCKKEAKLMALLDDLKLMCKVMHFRITNSYHCYHLVVSLAEHDKQKKNEKYW